jgi:hypothetical protein
MYKFKINFILRQRGHIAVDVHGFIHILYMVMESWPVLIQFLFPAKLPPDKKTQKKKKHGGPPRLFSVTLVVGNPSASLLPLPPPQPARRAPERFVPGAARLGHASPLFRAFRVREGG